MSGSKFFVEVFFWLFAVLAVAPGLGILLAKDIVRQAFWLLLSLAGFAGLYLHLGADFLGFTQVVVYIGGVLILFLFGVMLTHKMDIPLRQVKTVNLVVPGIVTGLISAVTLLLVVFRTDWVTAPEPSANTVSSIGSRLMSDYLLPFEVVSVVLLVALVGATYVARRTDDEKGGEG
jgi:NADH-quinone oxidoreductase subunit J